MRRRDFITIVGGAAAWPITTYAQQRDGQPRIGVLMTSLADSPEGQARIAAFLQGLQQLGWTDGRNIQIDVRWSGGNDAKMRKNAAELVALAPEIIVASGSAYRPSPAEMAESRRTATRFTSGAICLSRSNHFPPMLYSKSKKPVALPPVCALTATIQKIPTATAFARSTLIKGRLTISRGGPA
jgi:hypothetical protein